MAKTANSAFTCPVSRFPPHGLCMGVVGIVSLRRLFTVADRIVHVLKCIPRSYRYEFRLYIDDYSINSNLDLEP